MQLSRMTDCTSLTPEAIDVAGNVAFLNDGGAGGVCLFTGTTRADKSDAGAELVALEYEAYEAMARQQLQDLGARARERWPILKLVVVHRVGRVEVGDISVLIGVCTPHRAEAFEACRWLIDTLKTEVTIWKKEVWSEGEASWVEPTA